MLIPLLFMGDVVGRLFHEFAITMAVAILISRGVAHAHAHDVRAPAAPAARAKSRRAAPLAQATGLFDGTIARYGRAPWVLAHRA